MVVLNCAIRRTDDDPMTSGQFVDPDVDVVLSAKDITMLSGEPAKQHMIVQLHDHNYIQHLPSSHLLSERRTAKKAEDLHEMLYGYRFHGDYHFQPAFAAGHVVLSSFAELLLAQCFYNPEIISIVQSLAGGGMSDTKEGPAEAYKKCNRTNNVQLYQPKVSPTSSKGSYKRRGGLHAEVNFTKPFVLC